MMNHPGTFRSVSTPTQNKSTQMRTQNTHNIVSDSCSDLLHVLPTWYRLRCSIIVAFINWLLLLTVSLVLLLFTSFPVFGILCQSRAIPTHGTRSSFDILPKFGNTACEYHKNLPVLSVEVVDCCCGYLLCADALLALESSQRQIIFGRHERTQQRCCSVMQVDRP